MLLTKQIANPLSANDNKFINTRIKDIHKLKTTIYHSSRRFNQCVEFKGLVKFCIKLNHKKVECKNKFLLF